MCDEIRIYVACLAAYNSGYLHGRWIDATLELGDIQEQVTTMLAASPIDQKITLIQKLMKKRTNNLLAAMISTRFCVNT